MPNMHDNTKLLRVPLGFAQALKQRADRERRTMTAQLQLEVEAGLQARQASRADKQ